MRRGKNRERADDIQGLDDLDRSVLLGSHYQAIVKFSCHLEHLKDELSSAGLQSCFCQLRLELKDSIEEGLKFNNPPDILFLQSLKHSTLD